MNREQELKETLQQEIEGKGYYLNPDDEFTLPLLEGLLINEKIATATCFVLAALRPKNKQEDLDLVCPCDYRDEDIEEHGACYCGLYVNEEISQGKRSAKPIPDRRKKANTNPNATPEKGPMIGELPYPVFRCKVCGYLCARSQPPGKCPVCGAQKERFERFL